MTYSIFSLLALVSLAIKSRLSRDVWYWVSHHILFLLSVCRTLRYHNSSFSVGLWSFSGQTEVAADCLFEVNRRLEFLNFLVHQRRARSFKRYSLRLLQVQELRRVLRVFFITFRHWTSLKFFLLIGLWLGQ
jgi:hypothetical protein